MLTTDEQTRRIDTLADALYEAITEATPSPDRWRWLNDTSLDRVDVALRRHEATVGTLRSRLGFLRDGLQRFRDERDAQLRVALPCPFCRADYGEPCRRASDGSERPTPHASRPSA